MQSGCCAACDGRGYVDLFHGEHQPRASKSTRKGLRGRRGRNPQGTAQASQHGWQLSVDESQRCDRCDHVRDEGFPKPRASKPTPKPAPEAPLVPPRRRPSALAERAA